MGGYLVSVVVCVCDVFFPGAAEGPCSFLSFFPPWRLVMVEKCVWVMCGEVVVGRPTQALDVGTQRRHLSASFWGALTVMVPK